MVRESNTIISVDQTNNDISNDDENIVKGIYVQNDKEDRCAHVNNDEFIMDSDHITKKIDELVAAESDDNK